MKKLLIAAAASAAFSGVAHAQTAFTIYGILDTAIRYTSNEDAAGHSKVQLGDGALYGSRLGLRGTEDLGGGNQAQFTLESGFGPDTGVLQQGGRLFGRQAYVGLGGNYGTILLGRQQTVAHDMMSSLDVAGFTGIAFIAYESGNFTGLRYDNTLKYINKLGPVTISAGHTFGEAPGSFKTGSADAASLAYESGAFRVGTVYQVTQNVSSTYFNAVPASLASKQTMFGVGGSYQWGPAKLFTSYTHNRLNVADYTNDTVAVGVNYQLSPTIRLISSVHYDWLKHLDTSGKRLTSYAVLDYSFSKRTAAYVEVEYTRLKDAWAVLNSNSGTGISTYGLGSRTGVMVGMRHFF